MCVCVCLWVGFLLCFVLFLVKFWSVVQGLQSPFPFHLLHLLWDFSCSCFVLGSMKHWWRSTSLSSWGDPFPSRAVSMSGTICFHLAMFLGVQYSTGPDLTHAWAPIPSDAVGIIKLWLYAWVYENRTKITALLLDRTGGEQQCSNFIFPQLSCTLPQAKELVALWLWSLGHEPLYCCPLTTLASEHSQKLGRTQPIPLLVLWVYALWRCRLHNTLLSVCGALTRPTAVAQFLHLTLQETLFGVDFWLLSKQSFHLTFSDQSPVPQILFIWTVWFLLHTRQLPDVGDSVESPSTQLCRAMGGCTATGLERLQRTV